MKMSECTFGAICWQGNDEQPVLEKVELSSFESRLYIYSRWTPVTVMVVVVAQRRSKFL